MRRVVSFLVSLFVVALSLTSLTPPAAAASARAASGAILRIATRDLASPTSPMKALARQALLSHAVVAASGTRVAADQLGALLGVALPQASVNQPVQIAFVGAHLDSANVLRVYEGFAAAGSRVQAAAQLNQWASAQLATQSTAATLASASAPSMAGWTPLTSATTTYTDTQGSSERFSMSDYRLNDLNSGGDWYLFASQLQTSPNNQGCDSNSCGPYVIERYVSDPGTSLFTLTDHGATTTITGSTVGWSVGTSLSAGTDVAVGVNTTYSQSWDQPSVATIDTTSGNTAGWQENFVGPSYNTYPAVVPPPSTAIATFVSDQAAIFEVPEGTASASLTSYGGYETETDTWSSYTCGIFFTCYSESSHYVGVELSLKMTPQPPVLAVSPVSLSISRGTSATLNIQALVPGSTQGLAWDITNNPPWLALSQLSGSSAASITLTVPRKTPIGSVAYLNLSTSPPYAAPSVERGPIVVPVTVTR